jgi:hypothetical protein
MRKMSQNLSSIPGETEPRELQLNNHRYVPHETPLLFKRFAQRMSPALKAIRRTDKKSALREIYALAKEKNELEQRRIDARAQARKLRKERIQIVQIRAHMYNALKSLEKAKGLCQGKWLRSIWECFESDGSISFMRLIRHEIGELLFWEDLNSASILPELRTQIESRTTVKLPFGHDSERPGFNVTWTEYWFIRNISQCLGNCGTSTGAALRPIDYERIISAAFMAAFSEAYDPRRVKTARRRIMENERQSDSVFRYRPRT